MGYIYHFAHIGFETWEKEPIKVILGFEIWFLVCLLVAWGIASWRLRVKTTSDEKIVRNSNYLFKMIWIYRI